MTKRERKQRLNSSLEMLDVYLHNSRDFSHSSIEEAILLGDKKYQELQGIREDIEILISHVNNIRSIINED